MCGIAGRVAADPLVRVDAGLGFRDIAETLGITETNAKVNFHHAVKRLRALVTDTPEEESR